MLLTSTVVSMSPKAGYIGFFAKLYFLTANTVFLSPEQVIGETVLNAQICLGTLLVDQTLDLVQPPPPIVVVDEKV